MSLRSRLGVCTALLFVLAACGEQVESPSATGGKRQSTVREP